MSSAVMIGQPPPAPTRVLIVEDDQVTRESLARLFRLNGAEVVTASSLGAALDELAWQPHWVVLDLHLSRDNGEDLLHAIRHQRLPVKVAVVTGSADRSRLAALKTLHPDCILIKPIQFSALLECVKPSPPPSMIA